MDASRPKMFIRSIGLWFINCLASEIRDVKTGETLGRALMIPWRGRIIMLGEGFSLVPQFRPQARLTFWKRELGFTRAPEADFPHVPRS